MIDYNTTNIFNPGILTTKIPDEMLKSIQAILLDPLSKQIEVNSGLIGSIQQEFETPEIPELKKFINDMYAVWKKTYAINDTPYEIGRIWTNYMRKGEFNPNHCHPEALAAFVLWASIPYDINDEIEYQVNRSFAHSHPPKNSAFEFTYSMLDGTINTFPIYVDKNTEGTIIMFPGTLMHCVYPFYTSDEERISIAGNIVPNFS